LVYQPISSSSHYIAAIPNSKFLELETLDLSLKLSSIERALSAKTTQIRSEFGIDDYIGRLDPTVGECFGCVKELIAWRREVGRINPFRGKRALRS
jgi:hypothetical protein